MQFSELHKLRTAVDYRAMCELEDCPFLQWKPTKGEPPYVEEYLLTINIKSYISPDTVSEYHTIRIGLPPEYPRISPRIVMEKPVIYHPHWNERGQWDFGHYKITESLPNFIERMIQDIQYNSFYINPTTGWNREAARWYLANPQLFPTDTKNLSDYITIKGFRRLYI